MQRTSPQTIDEAIQQWLGLDGTRVKDATCWPELLARLDGAAHLALALKNDQGETGFYLDFWVRTHPPGPSPLILLNTRVSDFTESSVKHLYTDIIGLLAKFFPPHTVLVTFVRQSDSLAVLEEARVAGKTVNPKDLFLVKLFESGGWKFLKLTTFPDAPNPRRRHLIRFQSTV